MPERDGISLRELLGRIYDAALEPVGWLEVVKGVERHLAAHSSLLFLAEPTMPGPTGGRFITESFTAKNAADYYAYYRQCDPGWVYKQSRPAGVVSARNLHMGDRQFAESEYFRDYGRFLPADVFYQAGLTIANEDGLMAVLAVQRGKRGGPFTPRDLRRLAGLYPHLRRAFQVGRRLDAGEAERRAQSALLDAQAHGIVLLDERGAMVWANRCAERLLAAADGLIISAAGLAAAEPGPSRQLRRLIRRTVGTGRGEGHSAGGAMRLERPSGAPPLDVLVAPLPGEQAAPGLAPRRVCAAVFLREPGQHPALMPSALMTLYGLTPAEARLACALAEGLSLAEAAERNSVSRETVRSQLKAVRAKMGLRRQAEVVREVLSLPAALPAGTRSVGA